VNDAAVPNVAWAVFVLICLVIATLLLIDVVRSRRAGRIPWIVDDDEDEAGEFQAPRPLPSGEFAKEEAAIQAAVSRTLVIHCDVMATCERKECRLGCPDFRDSRRGENSNERTVVINRRKLQCLASS
jgi:hypothetical protein